MVEDDRSENPGDEEITQVRVNPAHTMTPEEEKRVLTKLSGREMTLEDEKRFLARLFSEAIGHDGWTIPVIRGETEGGNKDV